MTIRTPEHRGRVAHSLPPIATKPSLASSYITLAACLGLSACATLFAPGPDTILVKTNPPGARVLLDGLPVGTTPASFQVSRRAAGNLSIQVADRPPLETKLTTTLNGAVLVNVLFPGLLGIIIDALGGNCTRWQSPQMIELNATEIPHPQEQPSVIADSQKDQPNDAAMQLANATRLPASSTPTTPTAGEAPQIPLEPQPAARRRMQDAGFFITPDGYSLWSPTAASTLAGSTQEVLASTEGSPTVRKSSGRHAYLAIETATPPVGSTIYFLDSNGALAEGSVTSAASPSGTIQISTQSSWPPLGAPLVDQCGSVVGSCMSHPSAELGQEQDFAALSCVALQQLLRKCPTVTRPLPAPTRASLDRTKLEAILRAAVQPTREGQ